MYDSTSNFTRLTTPTGQQLLASLSADTISTITKLGKGKEVYLLTAGAQYAHATQFAQSRSPLDYLRRSLGLISTTLSDVEGVDTLPEIYSLEDGESFALQEDMSDGLVIKLAPANAGSLEITSTCWAVTEQEMLEKLVTKPKVFTSLVLAAAEAIPPSIPSGILNRVTSPTSFNEYLNLLKLTYGLDLQNEYVASMFNSELLTFSGARFVGDLLLTNVINAPGGVRIPAVPFLNTLYKIDPTGSIKMFYDIIFGKVSGELLNIIEFHSGKQLDWNCLYTVNSPHAFFPHYHSTGFSPDMHASAPGNLNGRGFYPGNPSPQGFNSGNQGRRTTVYQGADEMRDSLNPGSSLNFDSAPRTR